MILRVYRKEFVYALLFALCNSLIFHSSQLAPVAFVSLIPLFFCIQNCTSRREAAIFGYLAGLLQTAITYYWILHVTKFGYLALCVYLAIFPCLFSIISFGQIKALSHMGQKGYSLVWVKFLTLAAIWTLVEFIRGNVPVMKFPWALLAYSQWKNTVFIQSADLFGAYGVTFVIAIANAALFCVIVLLVSFVKNKFSKISLIGGLLAITLFGAGLPILNHAYGTYALSDSKQSDKSGVMYKIVLVQGNIPQEEKWNEKIKKIIFDKYESLSRQAIMDHPDMIVWPETSFPGYWEDEPGMVQQLFSLSRDLRAHFLVGAPTLRAKDDRWERMNSAIFISRDGGEIGRHHKIRLVPFGEYIPFFKFIRDFFEEIGHFSPGELLTLFELPSDIGEAFGKNAMQNFYPKMSVLICFEDIFPDFCRKFVRGGSNLLVNLTNDAWFKNSTGPYQHAQSSVFRAVENRVPVIRAANTGLSCFINPSGVIEATVNKSGEEIMINGFKSYDVKLFPELSLYTEYGDYFMWVLLLLCLATFRLYHQRISQLGDKEEEW